jgi:uncharacterized protein (TIGR02996 family)
MTKHPSEPRELTAAEKAAQKKLIRAILYDRMQESHREDYAYWLDHHGDPEQARFVRNKIEAGRQRRDGTGKSGEQTEKREHTGLAFQRFTEALREVVHTEIGLDDKTVGLNPGRLLEGRRYYFITGTSDDQILNNLKKIGKENSIDMAVAFAMASRPVEAELSPGRRSRKPVLPHQIQDIQQWALNHLKETKFPKERKDRILNCIEQTADQLGWNLAHMQETAKTAKRFDEELADLEQRNRVMKKHVHQPKGEGHDRPR